jgi:hypothetical protein
MRAGQSSYRTAQTRTGSFRAEGSKATANAVPERTRTLGNSRPAVPIDPTGRQLQRTPQFYAPEGAHASIGIALKVGD